MAEDAEGEIGDGIEQVAQCALSFELNTAVATPQGEMPIAQLKAGDQVLAYDPTTGKTSPQTVQHVWITHDTDLLDLHLQTRVQLDPSVTRRLARAPLEGEPAGRAPPTQDSAQSGTASAAGGTNGTGTLVRVTDEVVHTTANHPWLTADRGWLPAGQLRPGEPLVTLAGVAAAASAESSSSTAGTATTMQAVVLGAVVVPGAAPMWDLSVANVHTFGVGAGQWVVHNCNFGSNKSKIDWAEIESGHVEGGSRVSPQKSVFTGLSKEQAHAVVSEAWKNRVKVGEMEEQGISRRIQRWMGEAGGWKVGGIYNYVTDEVETAFPIYPEFTDDGSLRVPGFWPRGYRG